MSGDFLMQFLGNAPRARLLRAFVFSPLDVFTLSRAAKRAGTSIPSAAREIHALEKMGILKEGKLSITIGGGGTKRVIKGKKQKERTWTLNQNFKHTRAITSFVHEVSPVQYRNILQALKSSGRLSVIILSGVFMGDTTRPADLVVVGNTINEKRLEEATKKLEKEFGREIRYATFSTPEFRYRLTIQDRLIRETMDYPHLVLLDRVNLL